MKLRSCPSAFISYTSSLKDRIAKEVDQENSKDY